MSTSKKRRRRDPHAEREASRYEHPVPSREHVLDVLGTHGAPLGFEALAGVLGVGGARDQRALQRRLQAMERDGQLICNRRGEYGLVPSMDLVRGRVSAHRDGFGFVIPDEGSDGDLFLPSRQMRAVMHGDRVLARVTAVDRQGRREGSVVEILERNTQRVVGRLERESGITFVNPDNARIHQDVLIPPGALGNAQPGEMVVAEIVEQPTKRTPPIGRIEEILGTHMAPGMEIDVAIRSHGLPHEWPVEVEREAADVPGSVRARDRRGRVDLRETPLVTIDGADARDFDDAVWCTPTPSGWKLLVAIADVGAYVRPGSAIDVEAERRGNSVYFPGNVIPMLPEVLSNGLCSLNPEVDRLCMVCEMQIGADGELKRSRFFEAVMRSHARLTYDEVAAVVERPRGRKRAAAHALAPELGNLHALYLALRKARARRGAVDLDTVETRIVFGDERKVARIEPVRRNDAHRMIEECMISANVAAARFLQRHRLPALYRVHETPSTERIEDLRAFLADFGLRLAGGAKPEPRHFSALIDRAADRPYRELVQTLVLRSMAQAVYAPDNVGHFGLALPAYSHFTSPIRRFPDLLTHRAIKHVLAARPRRTFPYSREAMVRLGEHTSMTERRADEATRAATEWLKCEFMLDKVGRRFPGIVSGVAAFGVFVTLDDLHVDGLLHVSALGSDYFHFEPVRHRLVGKRSGAAFGLGDRLEVRVSRVDLDERKVDFELAGTSPGRRGGARSRR